MRVETDTDNSQKHSDTLQGDDSRQSKDTQTEEYQRIQQDQSQEVCCLFITKYFYNYFS